MKISEILWKAANEHLWDGDNRLPDFHDRFYEASCPAVAEADGSGAWMFSKEAIPFLSSLGLTPSSRTAFNEFEFGPQRQGARYAWLMFASMVAEEWGL